MDSFEENKIIILGPPWPCGEVIEGRRVSGAYFKAVGDPKHGDGTISVEVKRISLMDCLRGAQVKASYYPPGVPTEDERRDKRSLRRRGMFDGTWNVNEDYPLAGIGLNYDTTKQAVIEKEIIVYQNTGKNSSVTATSTTDYIWDFKVSCVNCHAYLTVAVHVEFDIGWQLSFCPIFGNCEGPSAWLERAVMYLEGKAGVSAQLVAQAKAAYKKTWEKQIGPDVPLNFVFTLGIIPVYVDTIANLFVEITTDLSASGEATYGFTATNVIQLGYGWSKKDQGKPININTATFKEIPFQASVSGKGQVIGYVKPPLKVTLAKMMSTTLQLHPYIGVDAAGVGALVRLEQPHCPGNWGTPRTME
ncbi:hypothetical protein HK104_002602 [Borealophlyctis nickersoniae]|nr:hypothetical protein HK104_002602 [Borealophlyctis nickersoniae]